MEDGLGVRSTVRFPEHFVLLQNCRKHLRRAFGWLLNLEPATLAAALDRLEQLHIDRLARDLAEHLPDLSDRALAECARQA